MQVPEVREPDAPAAEFDDDLVHDRAAGSMAELPAGTSPEQTGDVVTEMDFRKDEGAE